MYANIRERLVFKIDRKVLLDERSADIKTADDSIRLFESWLATKNDKDLKDVKPIMKKIVYLLTI